MQPFVHGYRECNTPVQVKGGSLAQLSGASPLNTGYYLTQKAARNQLRCPSPLSGKSKRKGGTHVKLTRHNGRAGKNGVYNPKHNDRSFDIANSEHIDEERAKQNLYWDCYNGFRNFKNPEKENELSATFEDVEQLFYPMKHIRQTENDNVCLEVLLIPLTFFPLTEQATAASFRLWSILKGLRFIFWRMNRLPESISIRCGQKLWRFTEAAISV